MDDGLRLSGGGKPLVEANAERDEKEVRLSAGEPTENIRAERGR